MGINRSGYYKWKARQGQFNRYEQDRIVLTELLHEEHERHPSLGYHRLARNIFRNTGWVFSDNLAHKCCKEAGIHSKARKYRYKLLMKTVNTAALREMIAQLLTDFSRKSENKNVTVFADINPASML